jgi:3'-phosphoadenosine 5'-phosphosulfate sulfotransferase (PAPS reductase)/FAD synthetase
MNDNIWQQQLKSPIQGQKQTQVKGVQEQDHQELKKFFEKHPEIYLHSLTKNYKAKVKKTIERTIDIFSDFLISRPQVGVSISGGKDSQVMLDIMVKSNKLANDVAQIYPIFFDAGSNYPETLENIKQTEKKYLKLEFYHIKTRKPLKDLYAECGWFGYNGWLKDSNPIHYTAEQIKTIIIKEPSIEAKKHLNLCFTCVGLRQQESKVRNKMGEIYGDYYYNKSSEIDNFYPLLEWSYLDVWAYIYENNLTPNSLYLDEDLVDISQSRIASYLSLTAISNGDSKRKLRKYHPKIYADLISEFPLIFEPYA